MLGPGDSFEYDSLVMRVHSVVPAANASVFSICRKGPSNPCSDPKSITISPGVQASVGVEYYSGSLYGFLTVMDAAACAGFCAGVANCGGWTVDVGANVCWLHDPSVPWATIANPNAFSGKIQRPSKKNSPPVPPPPAQSKLAQPPHTIPKPHTTPKPAQSKLAQPPLTIPRPARPQRLSTAFSHPPPTQSSIHHNAGAHVAIRAKHPSNN